MEFIIIVNYCRLNNAQLTKLHLPLEVLTRGKGYVLQCLKAYSLFFGCGKRLNNL